MVEVMIHRREFLSFFASAFATAATLPNTSAYRVWERRYQANAAILFCGIQIFSKRDVGGGYAAVEEVSRGENTEIALQFAGGSWPEKAHGVNRLGFLQETVTEKPNGEPADARYFGFMTSSAEKNFDQARQSLTEAGAKPTPYTATVGAAKQGRFSSTVYRLLFPNSMTWADCPRLIQAVGEAAGHASGAPQEAVDCRVPHTFHRRERTSDRYVPQGECVRESRLFFHWKNNTVCRRYRTGVSLHGHTLHSRESLDFLTPVCAKIPYVAQKIDEYKGSYFQRNGRHIDLKRAWWTPPLSPKQAWHTEKSQIENTLDLEAQVSLSDHDNIEAGAMLSLSEPAAQVPISVEWTVPFRETYFHLGIHNLPPFEARGWMNGMEAFTACPGEDTLAEMLDALQAYSDTLLVFNHPMWDEKFIGAELHHALAEAFWERYGQFLHAMELNGLRPWQENERVAQLAKACGTPAISGGDRHAREPNACVNLTNAGTFPEFVEEIRRDGWSDVLFLPQYRENFKVRIIQNMCEVLRVDQEHSLGWEKWSERIFYLCDDGVERSLDRLWGNKAPAAINHFIGLISLVEERWLRSALRFALPRKEEPAL